MIKLPPGCTLSYEIQINVSSLTDEIGEWFNMIGGVATMEKYYDSRGREKTKIFVQYGKAKRSYPRQDGTNTHLIRFAGSDAQVACMFLIKFMDLVVNHNMKEIEQYA
jgi:hypothetical protein